MNNISPFLSQSLYLGGWNSLIGQVWVMFLGLKQKQMGSASSKQHQNKILGEEVLQRKKLQYCYQKITTKIIAMTANTCNKELTMHYSNQLL